MGRIFQALRQAIKESKVSRYRIGKDLGIDQSVLSRFMSGEIGLTVTNVEMIAEYLGLEIIVRPKAKKGKKDG
jgi:transcriptional regulator with XRE-family HTH domain